MKDLGWQQEGLGRGEATVKLERRGTGSTAGAATSCKARPPSCHLQIPQHPTSDLRRDS